jgi:hypothetical protein
MASSSQRKATQAYRKRSKRSGLVRVEVQAPKEYSELIRSVAKALREDPAAAFEVEKAVNKKDSKRKGERTLLDMFASYPDISGPEFDEVFDQPRKDKWRKIEL